MLVLVLVRVLFSYCLCVFVRAFVRVRVNQCSSTHHLLFFQKQWPQYCSHILQITHLRQIRPDLIDYIEKISLQASAAGSSSSNSAANAYSIGSGSTSPVSQSQAAPAGALPPSLTPGAMGVPSSVVSGIATAGMTLSSTSTSTSSTLQQQHQPAAAAAQPAAPAAASNGAASAAAAKPADAAAVSTKDMMNPNFDRLHTLLAGQKQLVRATAFPPVRY